MTVYYNGNDYFAAESKAEALDLWEKLYGESRDDYPDMEWEEEPGDRPFRIHVESEVWWEGGLPATAKVIEKFEGQGGVYEALLSEWEAQVGKGLIASTEY